MKKFNPHGFDSSMIDKSQLGIKTDYEIAEELDVNPATIRYWRIEWGIPSTVENRDKERQEMFDRGLHWCAMCKQYHPVERFSKRSTGRFGLRTRCKDCRKQVREENSEYHQERRKRYYKENKETVRARNAQWREENADRISLKNRTAHRKNKEYAVSLFGDGCNRCGYNEFVSALEFHHVDPDTKEEPPTTAINSGNKTRIKKELDKCVMLCRNCHMAYHASEWRSEFKKREGIGWKIKE